MGLQLNEHFKKTEDIAAVRAHLLRGNIIFGIIVNKYMLYEYNTTGDKCAVDAYFITRKKGGMNTDGREYDLEAVVESIRQLIGQEYCHFYLYSGGLRRSHDIYEWLNDYYQVGRLQIAEVTVALTDKSEVKALHCGCPEWLSKSTQDKIIELARLLMKCKLIRPSHKPKTVLTISVSQCISRRYAIESIYNPMIEAVCQLFNIQQDIFDAIEKDLCSHFNKSA